MFARTIIAILFLGWLAGSSDAAEPTKYLRFLNLRNTKVTDEGLKELKGLKKLVSLDLSGTENISVEAVWLLNKSLPNCWVEGK